MKITREMIMEARTPRGAWNKPQLEAIGVTWPPTGGWIAWVSRREYTEEEVARFRELSTAKHKERTPPAADANVDAVRAKLSERMKTGLRKYGVTTERTDLSRKQWLIHAQEEAMDLAVYLERLIQDEESASAVAQALISSPMDAWDRKAAGDVLWSEFESQK